MSLIPIGDSFTFTLTSRHLSVFGISTTATTLPPAFTTMRAADADFALTTISHTASLPKSTRLYSTDAPFLGNIVFHPSNGAEGLINSISAPPDILLYLSISIRLRAEVTPTPRSVGVTLRIVPSALKKSESQRAERSLSNSGE